MQREAISTLLDLLGRATSLLREGSSWPGAARRSSLRAAWWIGITICAVSSLLLEEHFEALKIPSEAREIRRPPYSGEERLALAKCYLSSKFAIFLLSRALAETKNLPFLEDDKASLSKLIHHALLEARAFQKATRQGSIQVRGLDVLHKGIFLIAVYSGQDLVGVASNARELASILGISVKSARDRLARCFPGEEGPGLSALKIGGVSYSVEFVTNSIEEA